VGGELDAESRSPLAPVPQFMPTTQIGTTQASAPVALSGRAGGRQSVEGFQSCGVHHCVFSINKAVFRCCYDQELQPRWQ
jgi:hypothetical protein